MFGRGGEEAQALRSAGVPFEIVPGISAAIAAPAYAGIPLTHRAFASSVAIVTGHRAIDGEGSVNWSRLAGAVDTLVIVMGLHNLSEIVARLLEGNCEPERPVSLIQWGTRRAQKSLTGTIASIAELAAAAGFTAPTTIVIGHVLVSPNNCSGFILLLQVWSLDLRSRSLNSVQAANVEMADDRANRCCLFINRIA